MFEVAFRSSVKIFGVADTVLRLAGISRVRREVTCLALPLKSFHGGQSQGLLSLPRAGKVSKDNEHGSLWTQWDILDLVDEPIWELGPILGTVFS